MRDVVGTEIRIILEKLNDKGYLSHGLCTIKRNYTLVNGGWLKLFYLGNSEFHMEVLDRDLFHVPYPYPPTFHDFVVEDFEAYSTYYDDPWEQINLNNLYTQEITLSDFDSRRNTMVWFIFCLLHITGFNMNFR